MQIFGAYPPLIDYFILGNNLCLDILTYMLGGGEPEYEVSSIYIHEHAYRNNLDLLYLLKLLRYEEGEMLSCRIRAIIYQYHTCEQSLYL